MGRRAGEWRVAIDVTERRTVEQEQRFLGDASRILASSLEYEATMEELAQLATPMFGDYCAIDVLRDDGLFSRIAVVVADPAKREIAEALRKCRRRSGSTARRPERYAAASPSWRTPVRPRHSPARPRARNISSC